MRIYHSNGTTASFSVHQVDSVIFLPYILHGNGTIESPYNIAGLNEAMLNLKVDENSGKDIYFKGIVAEIVEINPTYGNATLYLSDDGTLDNYFYVYRCKGYNGMPITDTELIHVGDTLVMGGVITNYHGIIETLEQQSFIYSINGKTVPAPEIIEMTCTQAASFVDTLGDKEVSEKTYSIKGYITEVVGTVSRNQQTFWMADTKDGGKVLEAYWANLPEGIREFSKGDKVRITGKLMKYMSTPEIKNATVEILESSDNGNDNDDQDVENIEDNCMTIANLPSDITVNSYGMQSVTTEASWISWTWKGVDFSGCKICKATSIDGTIQVQGNNSDTSKQGFIFNRTAWPKNINQITLVLKANNTFEPAYSLYVGSKPHPTTGQITWESMSVDYDNKTYTQVFDLTGLDARFFTIWNNQSGALYIEKIIIQ